MRTNGSFLSCKRPGSQLLRGWRLCGLLVLMCDVLSMYSLSLESTSMCDGTIDAKIHVRRANKFQAAPAGARYQPQSQHLSLSFRSVLRPSQVPAVCCLRGVIFATASKNKKEDVTWPRERKQPSRRPKAACADEARGARQNVACFQLPFGSPDYMY